MNIRLYNANLDLWNLQLKKQKEKTGINIHFK